MRILQVSSSDFGGGAEGSAWKLFRFYSQMGHESFLAVGTKSSQDNNVFAIPNDNERNCWAQFWLSTGTIFLSPFRKSEKKPAMVSTQERSYNPQDSIGMQIVKRNIVKVNRFFPISKLLELGLGQPRRSIGLLRGYEDYDFPASRNLLELVPHRPDILHCHNLHGNYFDLSVLPKLSAQIPTILNLRDAWLISGHCAHSFACERWKTGCGQCPDLSIYPAISGDATAYNWQRKKEIFSRSRFYIATPSQWLMDRVDQSILAPAVIEKRVIPNGIDLTIFRPRDRLEARAELGLPANAQIVIFAANGIRANIWKDYRTMECAIRIAAKNIQNSQLLFLALGENAPDERNGAAVIHFVPHQRDPHIVARYFQAADIYIHAAHAETFSNTVAEARACGTPVVATAIGAIPEQLRDGVTGFLTPPGDAPAMATAIQRLLEDHDLRDKMGKAGVDDVRSRFSLELQASRFLRWYDEILADHV